MNKIKAFKNWIVQEDDNGSKSDKSLKSVNIDYLKSKVPDSVSVDLRLAPTKGLFTGDYRLAETTQLKFHEFLDLWRTNLEHPASTCHYLAQVPVINFLKNGDHAAEAPLSGLAGDVGQPMAFVEAVGGATEQLPDVQVNLWMSPFETCSATHYDCDTGLLVVVRGSKTVFLAPPSWSGRLTAHSLMGEAHHHSSQQISDLKVPFSVTVGEGEGLLIPRGFWHEVRSEAGTVALNYWFRPVDGIDCDVRLKESLVCGMPASTCSTKKRSIQQFPVGVAQCEYEKALHACRRPLQSAALSLARLKIDQVPKTVQIISVNSSTETWFEWIGSQQPLSSWVSSLTNAGTQDVCQWLSKLTTSLTTANLPLELGCQTDRAMLAFLLTDLLDKQTGEEAAQDRTAFFEQIWPKWQPLKLIALRTQFLDKCFIEMMDQARFIPQSFDSSSKRRKM